MTLVLDKVTLFIGVRHSVLKLITVVKDAELHENLIHCRFQLLSFVVIIIFVSLYIYKNHDLTTTGLRWHAQSQTWSTTFV